METEAERKKREEERRRRQQDDHTPLYQPIYVPDDHSNSNDSGGIGDGCGSD